MPRTAAAFYKDSNFQAGGPMKSLSHLTERFEESVIREMTRICEAQGGLNLAQGFPDFDAPQEIKEAAVRAIRDGHNQYPITYGESSLRRAIAAKARSYNGLACDPETEITVTCGATEAMIATLKAVVNPGDEIIVFEPFYENYGPDAILSGASPRYVALQPPAWNYDPGELAAAFNRRTKAIIINTPNNPTGKVFSRRELAEIARLCLKWDCLAVTDEIYEHILYDGQQHISLATLDGMRERTVTINSISKTYSVTGWRVGWAIGPEKITQRIRKVHDFLTVGAPTPLQAAAALALQSPPAYYQGLQARYHRARELLFQALTATGFRVAAPQGSYYILAGTDELMRRFRVSADVAFSLKLLEVAGVATVPGSAFYGEAARGRNLVRFTFCKKEETLLKVGEKLRRSLLG